MATKKTTPEPEVQPDAELEVQPGLEPDLEPAAELEVQPDAEPAAELEVQPDAELEKPRDALDYIREQRGEG